jgi:hypothetical protein
MNTHVAPVVLAFLVAPLLAAEPARAQQSPSAPAGGSPGAAPAPAATSTPVLQVPGGPTISAPAGGGKDMNAHLPSAGRPTTDLSRSADGFDLNSDASGAGTVRGGANAAAVLGAPTASTPGVHVVRRGDTLAEISERYFNTLYAWPKVWSDNPEIQNPNWIYPGDQVRLRPPQAVTGPDAQPGAIQLGAGAPLRRTTVAPNTVFLRDQGWIDDPAKDTWGELAASFDDHMFLTPGDDVYVQIEGDHDVKVGADLAIFRPLRPAEGGQVVSVIGTIRVRKWDPDNKVVQASVVDAYDTIERGAKVGAVGRRFDVVPVVRNGADVEASVTASLYPHVIYGANQVVFVDKGEKDGLEPGNRLFVVRKGDRYRATLTNASRFATSDVRYENDRAVIVAGYTGSGLPGNAYPEEVVGEIRVLRTRDHTATCLVTNATIEIEPGDKLIGRRGY